MKVNEGKTEHVQRRDTEAAEKADDKKKGKSFKELLECKRERKGGRSEQRAGSTSPDKPRPGDGRPAGDARLVGDEHGRKLQQGGLQLGRQQERQTRADTQRHDTLQHQETRADRRQSERGWQEISSQRAQRDETQASHERDRTSGPLQRDARGRSGAGEGGGRLDMADGAVRAEGVSAGQAGESAKAEGAGEMQRSEMREQVAELARKLVEKAHVGQDAAGRRVMLLDLQVPGRGNVRVRLRRRGEGFEVRMRAENSDLARDLRRERETFRQTAAERGVQFSSIDIVG